MRRALLITAAGSLLSWAAPSFAQQHQQTKPAVSPPAGVKPNPARRRAFSYAECNSAARQNGLRGAQRRRFVARCQLGYETPVFKP